jgi:hypothetical protein
MSDAQALIGKITLTVDSPTVLFSNVPQTYADLVLVVSSRSTASNTEDYGYMYFNGDSGSNYSRVDLVGNNSSAFGGNSANLIPITSVGATGASNVWNTQRINIMEYSASDKQKTLIVVSTQPNSVQVLEVGKWTSLAPVTSISMTTYTGGASFTAGSTFTLYGVLA